MSNSSALPPGAALTVALLVLLGSALTMVGGIGLLRLKTFYSRAHAPTMGSSGGLACITAAGIVCFSELRGGLALEPILIFLFVSLTLPVTLILLSRAALFRDRVEGNPDVPPPLDTYSDAITDDMTGGPDND